MRSGRVQLAVVMFGLTSEPGADMAGTYRSLRCRWIPATIVEVAVDKSEKLIRPRIMIDMLLVDLVGIQVDPLTGVALLVLREHDAPNRVLPIVVGGAEAASIAIAAQGQTLPRPMTHDLMATLVERFDGHLDAVEVVDFQDGAFIANLAVSGPTGDLRLDTRPSDAIALAVRLARPTLRQ